MKLKRTLGPLSLGAIALTVTTVMLFQNCSGFSVQSFALFQQPSTGSAQIFRQSGVCPSGWICPANAILPTSTNVGAWFTMYWHSPSTPGIGSHWDAWTRYDPVAGRYSSGDPTTQRREIAEMKAAGIDYMLLDDTNGINNDGGAIDANIRNLFTTMQGLPASQRVPIAFALGAAEYKQSIADATVETNYVAGFANTYSDFYFQWRGKPLIVQYGPWDVAGEVSESIRNWRDDRFTFRYAAHHVNAMNPLVAAFAAEGLWGWVMQEPKLASASS